MDLLFAPEFTDLRDMPCGLFNAIRSALVFLSFENLLRKERPPRHLWLDSQALTEWFEEIERKRDGKGRFEDEIDDPVVNPGASSLVR